MTQINVSGKLLLERESWTATSVNEGRGIQQEKVRVGRV